MVKDKVGRPPGELGVRERESERERESVSSATKNAKIKGSLTSKLSMRCHLGVKIGVLASESRREALPP